MNLSFVEHKGLGGKPGAGSLAGRAFKQPEPYLKDIAGHVNSLIRDRDTIQRNCTDCIVTEFGIARLRGKTRRQRAQELINIAHPDFRSELKAEAQKLFG